MDWFRRGHWHSALNSPRAVFGGWYVPLPGFVAHGGGLSNDSFTVRFSERRQTFRLGSCEHESHGVASQLEPLGVGRNIK